MSQESLQAVGLLAEEQPEIFVEDEQQPNPFVEEEQQQPEIFVEDGQEEQQQQPAIEEDVFERRLSLKRKLEEDPLENEDTDRMFLWSVIPTLKKMKPDEKLLFQIQVLEMVRRFSDNATNSAGEPTLSVNTVLENLPQENDLDDFEAESDFEEEQEPK